MDYKRQTFPATDSAFENLDRVCSILKKEHSLKKYEIVSAVFELLDENNEKLIERANQISVERKQLSKESRMKKEKLLSLLEKLNTDQINNLIEGIEN